MNAAREQNIQLLEDVSNKISTIKRLESESSKLQHQLVRVLFCLPFCLVPFCLHLLQLSLEAIVNENDQKSNVDTETVRKLKDELNQMSIQNIQMRESVQMDYLQEMEQLKGNLAWEQAQYQKANSEIQNLRSKLESQDRNLLEITAKITEKEAELNDLQKTNVILRSKEINSDIQLHQKDQEFTELKEENEFLKAQVRIDCLLLLT